MGKKVKKKAGRKFPTLANCRWSGFAAIHKDKSIVAGTVCKFQTHTEIELSKSLFCDSDDVKIIPIVICKDTPANRKRLGVKP